ncbi:peptidase S10 [Rhodanobacter thiooxydans]|uniref:Peptidase S10 n=1 Tax=Rhodanobacter thiooxydans TaxID=416169 RepID=A0A154QF71_9GAMM|nr:peptidase S10 [Rhodanobacter thiooxydans]EIM03039.1 carboxypeptidase-like protein [Rhodanobacter thiooxydans LCS2]KZC22816.1 peptidase S10 [Rhodanobacter thiooxydans]MCW0200650.1 peptidase S10 [Rhodanobacter thiooxydans]
MRPSLPSVLLAAFVLAGSSLAPALAADSHKPAAAEAGSSDGFQLPPLPADAHVTQSTTVDGKTLKYTVTVGSLPVRDGKGKTTGEVVFTAYTMTGKDRPVTFALNGGPGASSVYLNLGAIGPKKVNFGVEGDSPSDPATLHDNPGTWLGFTDLVFIDPVGTGYSRALVDDKEATKQFYSTDSDIKYLSRIVYDWLVKNGRMGSRKYLVGESYGGFRGPRITEYLQTRLGVAMKGVVLLSPYLDPAAYHDENVSPLPWMLTLPSIAAAHLEREHRLSAEAMAPIVEYTRGEYASDLMRGRSDPHATDRVVKKVTELTGLDPLFVKRSGGRIETQAYLREVYRAEGKLGSRYDSNVTAWDPFPYAPHQQTGDPILNGIIAPTTSAMVDLVTRVVGWKVDGRYNALSYEVNKLWHQDEDADKGSVSQLREAVANDPGLRVLITHGWDDLSCPFMASVLIVDQMPAMGDPTRVQVKNYPGGHMFYSRADSQAALTADVKALYGVK